MTKRNRTIFILTIEGYSWREDKRIFIEEAFQSRKDASNRLEWYFKEHGSDLDMTIDPIPYYGSW